MGALPPNPRARREARGEGHLPPGLTLWCIIRSRGIYRSATVFALSEPVNTGLKAQKLVSELVDTPLDHTEKAIDKNEGPFSA